MTDARTALIDRTVLVTGGCRGIGVGITLRFLAEGWHVIATYAAGREGAEIFRNGLPEEPRSRLSLAGCDVRDPSAITALFAGLPSRHALPRLGAVVNNAGITGPKTRLAEADAAVIEDVFRVNAIGTILVCREAVRLLSTAHGGLGGAIVNISSTGTKLGNPGQWVHYAASKGAVDVFTQGLAREVAQEGIRVNAVSPGLTLSDPAQEGKILARLAEMGAEIPMARAASVSEVAAAVHWLCTDEASYVTGAVLPVAGGR